MKWFIFLPFISLQHQYPATQVTENQWTTHIDSHIETFPAWTRSSISRRTNKPFAGHMTPTQIIFSSVTLGKESITPVARMQIQRGPNGITVNTSVRPHGLIVILLGFLAMFYGLFLMHGIKTVLSQWSFSALNVFGSSLVSLSFFVGILYLVHQLFFSYEVHKIRIFLETLSHV